MPSDMKYSAAEVARMKNEVKDLEALLKEYEAQGETKLAQETRNKINGLKNSISGKYN